MPNAKLVVCSQPHSLYWYVGTDAQTTLSFEAATLYSRNIGANRFPHTDPLLDGVAQ
jgi:hypothetical protein